MERNGMQVGMRGPGGGVVPVLGVVVGTLVVVNW